MGRRSTRAQAPVAEEPSMFEGLKSLQNLTFEQVGVILDVLDHLREAGVEEVVSFPRIVVGGDTSSGKSSVLFRLTGVPFPSGDDVVMVFAIQVVMRPAANEDINVSIVPDPNREPAEAVRLKRFKRTIQQESDFDKVYKEAAREMGIKNDQKNLLGDMLRIEVRAPGCSPLEVIDLPGLIHATSATTSENDRVLSHKIVKQYIQHSRTIILAIVSASNDVRNQVITQYAREVDPEGSRTMGIITKPDSVKKRSGNENQWMLLANNREINFELGWHVLVNRIEKVNDATLQEIKECDATYFAHDRFTDLDPEILGINALRKRVTEITGQHLIDALPELQKEFQVKLNHATSKLKALGYQRADAQAQRTFLAAISRSFEYKATAAVEGLYIDQFFRSETKSGRRLRAEVRMLSDDFGCAMRKHGAALRVQNAINVEDAGKAVNNSGRTQAYMDWAGEGKELKWEDALKWVNKKLDYCQGSELPGGFNADVVKDLFWELSQNWNGLANKHIDKVHTVCTRFANDLLSDVMGKEAAEVKGRLIADRIEPLLAEAKQQAAHCLNLLTEDELTAPANYDYVAIENAHARWNARVQNTFIAPRLAANAGTGYSGNQRAQDALAQVLAFYYANLISFINTVNKQVIMREIAQKVPQLLSSEWAAGLSDEKLKELAEESPSVVRKRTELEKPRSKMQGALDKFKRDLGGLF